MEASTSKSAKESKMESVSRNWTPKPILSSELTEDPPLEQVYIGILKQKKDISTAIPRISNAVPGFHYLKRCSSNKLLLAPLKYSKIAKHTEEATSDNRILTQDELKTLLQDGGFDTSLLEDDFQIVNVPARAPKTKAQAARVSKIWPVNFHPDPNTEKLLDGSIFEEHQLQLIGNYTSVAMEAAKLEAVGNADCNGGAVIVDPEDGRILAVAASRIDLHPMWHAAMLAVDLVARLQGGGAWKLNDETDVPAEMSEEGQNIKRKYQEEAPLYYPKSLSKIRLPVQDSLKPKTVCKGRRNNSASKKLNVENSETESEGNKESCGPYLCTGYWVFLLKEPCPLCAMALLHSRVLRIFYGAPNHRTGVLGSNAILHAVPGLNHRYQVWSGILEPDCLQISKEIERRKVD